MKLIPLGSEVIDVVSGVKGLAVSMAEHISGNVQYAVQPKSEDGKSMLDAWNIDFQSLEVTGPGLSIRAKTPRVATIPLGVKVRDTASLFVGTTITKVTYMNGCVSYGVVPEMEKKALINSIPDTAYIFVDRLELVNLRDKLAQKTEVPSVAKPEITGGPSTRAHRM
jgi:hypothetical protein